MRAFDVTAVLLGIAAVCGYVNHRFLRLPASIGTMTLVLAGSLAVAAIDALWPHADLRSTVSAFVARVDFDETLLRGMLCFLLFAGALRIDLRDLRSHTPTVAALSTAGVLISTVIVGVAAHAVFSVVGADVSWPVCFVFGALISPTDPVAVLALLKKVRAARDLEVQIAAESLFNDGVGVVLFLSIGAAAGLQSGEPHALDLGALAVSFLRSIAGGTVVGLGIGYVAYRAIKGVDDYAVELLVTLALVMLAYSVSLALDVSGPIAVVVAGLLIGNPGRHQAMSAETERYLDAFWDVLDEILNAVLFLLLGLQAFSVSAGRQGVTAGLLLIPLILIARLISVAIPASIVRVKRSGRWGFIAALTWGGLRGALPVAMVLSLPAFGARELLLVATYSTVVFSIVVQGLSMQRVLNRFGLAAPA